ncbi:MAG: hypothetical protein Q9217_000765 [Psora testacea]
MAQKPGQKPGQRKFCFVTIGATAAFDCLIKAVLQPAFLRVLQEHDYTDLRLQHGKDGGFILKEHMAKHDHAPKETFGLNITGFDFKRQGLGVEMRAAKAGGETVEGVVISHAVDEGSGSVLGALRIAVPLIVVPNPNLLDNHQEELAEAMAEQGYAIHGRLDDLPSAIPKSEELRRRSFPWPPKSDSGDGRGLLAIMDDEMGFVD